MTKMSKQITEFSNSKLKSMESCVKTSSVNPKKPKKSKNRVILKKNPHFKKEDQKKETVVLII